MNVKKLFFLIFSAVLMLSCESRDGDWESMKWEIKGIDKENVEVSQSGGEYHFECKNYSNFWLTTIYINDQSVSLDKGDPEYNGQEYMGEWFSVKIEDNIFSVKFDANATDQNREASIGIQAGDAFDRFTFNQP